ncbi:MAG: Ig-like domain-containing protein, partial [Bifidobacteriaceae bacterium]|nr:Ig-like domain-containing protein [Bifidobacteriaceae bacterium]
MAFLFPDFFKNKINFDINGQSEIIKSQEINHNIKIGPQIDSNKKEPNSSLTEFDKQRMYDEGVGSLKDGTRSVIVQLKDINKGDLQVVNPTLSDNKAEQIIKSANLSNSEINLDYKKAINQKQTILTSELAIHKKHLKLQRKFESFPIITYLVDSKGLEALKNNSLVAKVEDDRVIFPATTYADKPLDPNPIASMGGNASNGFSLNGKNYNGSGYAVAVLDTGVDKNHPKLAGKVITEACFSYVIPSQDFQSLCPGTSQTNQGLDEKHNSGSAMPCGGTTCSHGTHVAGDATLAYQDISHDADVYNDKTLWLNYAYDYDLVSKAANGQGISGGARDGSVVAIQVFSINYSSNKVVSYNAAYMAALDWIYNNLDNRGIFPKPIAAVNMSLGSPGGTPESCYNNSYAQRLIFTKLMAKGVAVMISAGNSWADYKNNVGSPSCSLGATSVAAANTSGNDFATYSQNGKQTALVAVGGSASYNTNLLGAFVCPGSSVKPCTIGYNSQTWGPQANQHNNKYEWVAMQGTSMASPYAAGIFTSLRSYAPQASADDIINVMQATGYKLSDTRSGANTSPKPVIRGNTALKALSNTGIKPVIRYFETSNVGASGGSKVSLYGKVTPGSNCAINNKVGIVNLDSNGIFSISDVISTDSFILTCVNAQGDAYSSNTLDVRNYVSLNKLSVNPSTIYLYPNQKSIVDLGFSPSGVTNKLVDWQSKNPAVATVSFFNNSSQAEIKAVSAGNTTIDITSWTKDAQKVVLNIIVKKKVSGVSLSPKSVTIKNNQTIELTKTISPSDAADQAVAYQSSDISVATVNSIGLVTGITRGEVDITITTVDGSFKATSKIVVTQSVTGITVNPTNVVIEPNNVNQLIAVVTPTNANNKIVSWISFNESVAIVNSSGLVTAKNVGETIIKATTNDGGWQAVANVIVGTKVIGVSLSPKADSINSQRGRSQLTATVLPDRASVKLVNFSSSNSQIAEVDATGLVTAHMAGQVTITVTTIDGGFTDTAKFTVWQGVETFNLSPKKFTVSQLSCVQLISSIVPTDALDKNVTFSSTDITVAKVSQTGEVCGVDAGQTIIKGITSDGGLIDSVTVVVEPVPTSVNFNQVSLELDETQTYQLVAKVLPSNAVNKVVNYHSNDDSVVTINNKGIVTAMAAGQTQVIATTVVGGVTSVVNIKVYPLAESIIVKPESLNINKGQTTQLVPRVLPSATRDKMVNFSSLNPDIVTVDLQTGQVLANQSLGGLAKIKVISNQNPKVFAIVDIVVIESVCQIS